MAIVKHQTSKNANYGGVLEYYTFKHEEIQDPNGMHHELILDEFGFAQPRDNCAVCYITAHGEEQDPELWQTACARTNLLFKKNQDEGDRKSHEYIISHPEEDRPYMTMDDLMEEGRAFVRENLPGYDALIAVHRDTDNDHIHISINSVRALEREREEPWMMKDKTGKVLDCELKAGAKHQDSPGLRRHMNEWLLNYTREHGLIEKDNNAIADINRAKRHGTKNEQMRAALLEAAGRSQSVKDLQRILKKEYNMELKIRGNTFSIQHPEADKAVRLKTLELEPADLTRLMKGPEYTYTKATEDRQIQKEIEAEEQKKYIEWIRDRRQRNNERAESAILKAETVVSESVKARGERYDKTEFGDLLYLINQTFYIHADLQTEKDKLNRLLERWEQYRDTSLPEQERRRHAGYVKWCGCDPNSELEFADLKAELEIIDAQQKNCSALYENLKDTREQWKGHNDLERKIQRAEGDVEWTKNRRSQLKNQLRNVKASRKKLWEIYCNCRKSLGFFDFFNAEKMAKVDYFHDLWREKVQKEMELQKKIRDVKKQQKEAKERLREAKRRSKETYSK